MAKGKRKERGRLQSPPNRFEKLSHAEIEVEPDPDDPGTGPRAHFSDYSSRCICCYACPSHEYPGFSAGLDFETRIQVKRRDPGHTPDLFGN